MEVLIEAVSLDRQFDQLVEKSGMRLVNCGVGGGPCCKGSDMKAYVEQEEFPDLD